MQPSIETSVFTLLRSCTTVKQEGFRILLFESPAGWRDAVREYGSRAVSDACARVLNDLYRKSFGVSFLFSDACMSFEFRYHLNAYLWTVGLGKRRHITTLAIPKKLLERACRSIEIDAKDVYKPSQRFMFRYFFGIRSEFRRSVCDPYAVKIGANYVRIPFFFRQTTR